MLLVILTSGGWFSFPGYAYPPQSHYFGCTAETVSFPTLVKHPMQVHAQNICNRYKPPLAVVNKSV